MRSCAFTGHRPKSFSWKYDETASECLLLKEMLKKEIEKLLDCGVTDFYSGLAEGVDTWAAQIVLALREKNPTLTVNSSIEESFSFVFWALTASLRNSISCCLN